MNFKNKKKIIWDLMGGGQNSVRLALKENNLLNNYEVFTFDVIEQSNNFKNIVCDLSQDDIVKFFKNLIKNKIIKKPDIIVSSSLCQSFSLAMQSVSTYKDSKGNFFSGNPHHFWNHDKNIVDGWPQDKEITWNGFCGNSYPGGLKKVPIFTKELGERCVQNSLKLIQYFRPKTWYIENPAKSLIWKYINHNLNFKVGHLNLAHYSAYNNNFSRKPTCFLSNVKMPLKKIKNGQLSIKNINKEEYELILSGACKDNIKDELKRIRAENKLEKKLGYKIKVRLVYKKNSMERSKIPSELIVEIFKHFSNFKKEDFSSKEYQNQFELTKWTVIPKTVKEMIEERSI